MTLVSPPFPPSLFSKPTVPVGCMKIRLPSCSALAQNGWNFGSARSSPLTLVPTEPPRKPSFFTPSSSCCAARSGCCSATVAKPTKRSGCAAHSPASFPFWSLITAWARSRSALYQVGLIESAAMSIPCSSMARMRSSPMTSEGGATFIPISAIASGMATCACTSIVFTRLPLTSTSRCAGFPLCACAASSRLQPTNAIPAPRNSLRPVTRSDPLGKADDEAVAVRHLHQRKRLRVHHLVLGDELVEREEVRDERIHLVIRERPRRLERHRPADEVERRGGIAPEIGDRLGRLDAAGEGRGADERRRGGRPLRAFAVAHRAFRGEDRRALRGGAAARGQAGAVGQDADVPGRNVGFRDLRSQPGRLRHGRARAENEREERRGPKHRHVSPPPWRPPPSS